MGVSGFSGLCLVLCIMIAYVGLGCVVMARIFGVGLLCYSVRLGCLLCLIWLVSWRLARFLYCLNCARLVFGCG